jgi:hypothetical protein
MIKKVSSTPVRYCPHIIDDCFGGKLDFVCQGDNSQNVSQKYNQNNHRGLICERIV